FRFEYGLWGLLIAVEDTARGDVPARRTEFCYDLAVQPRYGIWAGEANRAAYASLLGLDTAPGCYTLQPAPPPPTELAAILECRNAETAFGFNQCMAYFFDRWLDDSDTDGDGLPDSPSDNLFPPQLTVAAAQDPSCATTACTGAATAELDDSPEGNAARRSLALLTEVRTYPVGGAQAPRGCFRSDERRVGDESGSG